MNAIGYINQSEYEPRFWNMARCRSGQGDHPSMGYNTANGTYALPAAFGKKLEQALSQESLFRGMTTIIRAYGNDYTLYAKDTDDLAQFVEEGGLIPVYDGIDDFTVSKIGSHKLAVFVKLDEDFVNDAGFSMEDYLTDRLGRNFGRAEDKGFITGSGVHEPTGILHADAGAEVGVTTGNLAYDDVVGLFFSVKPEYRRNGVWLMNDKTALALRTLKDADGNYLWNSGNDTILGKPVRVCEFMPDAASGNKPIAFGDFSYYWVVLRVPFSLRVLTEKFVLNDQIGYLALEYLDGKLVRRDAVKVLLMTA